MNSLAISPPKFEFAAMRSQVLNQRLHTQSSTTISSHLQSRPPTSIDPNHASCAPDGDRDKAN
eukprot:5717427-Amphidinium_carterae.1